MSSSKNAGTAPALAEPTPFVLILDTVYSVKGMMTRVPLRVVKAYPMLMKKSMSVIDVVKAVGAVGVEGAAIRSDDFSLLDLGGFKEKVLCLKTSLQGLKSSEQEFEVGFEFKSNPEASRIIGQAADRFANRLAASMGAGMAQGFEKQTYKLEASAVMEAFAPLVERFAEARQIAAVCEPQTVKAKPKAL